MLYFTSTPRLRDEAHGCKTRPSMLAVQLLTTGIHSRQDARWRKHRCLEQGQFVNVELALHYLHSRDLLHEVAIVPLFNLVSATDTRSKEVEIIQNWRPMYNHPWINRLHPTPTFRTTKFTITALSYTTKSSRLWKKVRRRLQTVGILRFYLTYSTLPFYGWDFLMMLGAGGQLAFDASRQLRSSAFSHFHVFALHRMANHLEDPPRSRVKALLRKSLQFRGMALPRHSKPLVIPLLAHPSFKQAVKRFLHQQLESIKDVLYNHLRLQRSWSWTTSPECSCGQLYANHADLQVIQGHVTSPARLLNVSRRLRQILSFSAATQVSPSLQYYTSTTSSNVKQWMARNGLNTYDPATWDQFIMSQWELHNQFAWTTVKKKDRMYLRQLLQGFVVHGRDHAVTEIFIFCPYIHWKVVRATFGEQQVHRSVTMTPTQTQQYLLQLSKQGWLRHYSWGRSSSSSSLPIAYILLKQKKDFQAARPIISNKYFFFANLFRATALVVDIISRETMPSSCGLHIFPAMMNQIVHFFQNVADDCQMECYNQDLVEFFTSIPVSRIMEAVDWMLQQSTQKYDINPATYSFSVSLREKDSKLRVWKGKARAAGTRMCQIYSRDILAIVRMSCDSSFFTVMGREFAQQRGAAIGNQISPVLASISVAYLEQTWHNQHEPFLTQVNIKHTRHMLLQSMLLCHHGKST